MKFLLLLLAASFFFIFFMFSKLSFLGESVFQNLYLEAQIYVVVGVFLAFYLFKKEKLRDVKNEKIEHEKRVYIPKGKIFLYIKIFFENYIYYIACGLFYISLFIIFKVILGEIHIPRIFLFFNILVVILHFFENKFRVFRDFVRVNTIVISAYYVFFHILYLFGYAQSFLLEDSINIALLLLLFIFFFRSSELKNYTSILASYMLSFLFLELCVLIKYFNGSIPIAIELLSFVGSAIFVIFTDSISKKLQLSRSLIRVWGLFSAYIFIIFSFVHIQEKTLYSLFLFFVLSYMAYVLYMFHTRFQNYVTLLFSSLAVLEMFVFLYLFLFPDALEKTYMPFLFFTLSASYILFDTLSKGKYIYDTYFFHIFSILVNLCGVILFFFYRDFSILELGILLLGESLYFFFSYYSLHNIAKQG